MRILLTGATGFVGRLLALMLMREGHFVLALSRERHEQGANPHFVWLAPSDPFPDADAIVNLAGEPISRRRLGKKRAAELVSSRLKVMDLLASKYEGRLPGIFIQASATGIYKGGCAGGEEAPLGDGFIAGMIGEIEKGAAERFSSCGRLVFARLGVVMGEGGGLMALTSLLPRIVLIGGSPAVPWVGIEDAARALQFILEHERLNGPVNIADPHAKSAAALLSEGRRGRPILPFPAFLLSLAPDHRADLLRASMLALPRKLAEAGFAFAGK
jgi:uncharacterized protein (TIGR01777 family)